MGHQPAFAHGVHQLKNLNSAVGAGRHRSFTGPKAGERTKMLTLTLPTELLATRDYSEPTPEGEDPTMIQPEQGDPVTFTVKGTIQSIAGNNATVQIAFVNDERPESDKDEAAEPDEASMKNMAAEADGE